MNARVISGFLAFSILALSADPRVPQGPLVSVDHWPRAVDLRTWVADIMRIEGLEGASETAQGKAFFEWLRLGCRMAVGGMIQAHEGPYASERYVLDAHKNLFVYGWGYCDTCSRIADAAWKEYKQDPGAAERVIVRNEGGGYHTKYRLRLDGHYGAFDPRYGYYLIDKDAPDARVLDWPEVGRDENILRNKTYKHRSRPFFEYFGKEWEKTLKLLPVYYPNQKAWEAAGAPLDSVFGDSHYAMGTKFHDMSFRLPRGTTITRFWDNSEKVFYRPVSERANRELPFLASGRFYRVNDRMFDGNWMRHDPNYARAEPYLTTVPAGQGYGAALEGGRTIGQAWGRIDYRPDLSDTGVLDALARGSSLVPSPSEPHLRPADVNAGGSATFDIYSPYVLVDGTLSARLSGKATVEMRVLQPKPTAASDPDKWSEWQPLNASGPIALGRPRFDGAHASIHGAYRLQLRVSVPPGDTGGGLNSLALTLLFENGIMSLPRLQSGANSMRFELADPAALTAPVHVTYRYETQLGNQSHTAKIVRGDFDGKVARYTIHAPGLIRCKSVEIRY